jgi:hypothetical protein
MLAPPSAIALMVRPPTLAVAMPGELVPAVALPPTAVDVDEPPIAEPPTAEPPTAALPVAEPPTAEPPTASPPRAEPPRAEPPTAEPPVAVCAMAAKGRSVAIAATAATRARVRVGSCGMSLSGNDEQPAQALLARAVADIPF